MDIRNWKVILSLAGQAWVVFVLFVQVFKVDIGTIGGVFWEILLLPVLLLILAQFLGYSFLWIREKFNKKSDNVYPIFINLISIVLLILLTISGL